MIKIKFTVLEIFSRVINNIHKWWIIFFFQKAIYNKVEIQIKNFVATKGH